MTEISERERRRRRGKGCGWTFGGVLVLPVLLTAGVGGYWRYANRPLTVTPAVVMLPSPNARDECLAAVALMPPDSRQVRVSLDEGRPVDLKTIVKAAQPALGKIRGSFRHKYLTPPITSYNARFPDLAQFRNIGNLFALEGQLAEQEGRYDDAVRSYLDCYRFGNEIQRGGAIFTGLVGNAVQAIALARLDAISPKLGEAAAIHTARELAQLEAASPTAADCLAVEAQFGELAMAEVLQQTRGSYQSLQKMANRGSQGWDWDNFQRSVRYTFTPKTEMLANYRRYMAGYVSEARKPYEMRLQDPYSPDDALSRFALPTLDGVVSSGTATEPERGWCWANWRHEPISYATAECRRRSLKPCRRCYQRSRWTGSAESPCGSARWKAPARPWYTASART